MMCSSPKLVLAILVGILAAGGARAGNLNPGPILAPITVPGFLRHGPLEATKCGKVPALRGCPAINRLPDDFFGLFGARALPVFGSDNLVLDVDLARTGVLLPQSHYDAPSESFRQAGWRRCFWQRSTRQSRRAFVQSLC